MDQSNISPKIKEAMDDAFSHPPAQLLPMLNGDEGRERFLHDLGRLTKWAQVMPHHLNNDEPWTKEQLHAMMLGPQNMDDPQFGAAWMPSMRNTWAVRTIPPSPSTTICSTRRRIWPRWTAVGVGGGRCQLPDVEKGRV